jgi:hypothetical protein
MRKCFLITWFARSSCSKRRDFNEQWFKDRQERLRNLFVDFRDGRKTLEQSFVASVTTFEFVNYMNSVWLFVILFFTLIYSNSISSISTPSPGSNSTKPWRPCWCSRQKNLITILLNWNTNMAAVTSCANALQGVPKITQNHWNNVLLKFECPSTKLNAKMRKILTRVHILNID